MKIFFVVGTRPNLIKLSPLSAIAPNYPEIDFKVVHTNQHYDYNMSKVFFEELELSPPDFFLEADNTSQTRQTATIMLTFETLCIKENPDGIVVFGDVNSTLAATLVAAKLLIPAFHIESGLRSFNRTMPEEINRIVTDHLCDVLYAPSQTAMQNLRNEGLSDKAIFTGDVMFDAVMRNIVIAEKKSDIIKKLNLKQNKYYLTTLHRPYNVDDKDVLSNIMHAFAQIDTKIVFAVHPRTLKNLKEYKIKTPSNIITTPPLGYFDFLLLQKHACKIITDSGGIQKEAFFLKKPCITLRPETEWVETLQCDANTLVPTRQKEDIIKAVYENKNADFSEKIYGDGNSALTILKHIKEHK